MQDKIDQLRSQMRVLDEVKEQLKSQPDGQLSMTAPGARSMATSSRGSGMVAYNVQVAMDAKHHLIVAHEVTNIGHDRVQLSSMAQAARDTMGKKRLKAIVDRGYFSATQIKACEDIGIAAILPKPTTSKAKAERYCVSTQARPEAEFELRLYAIRKTTFTRQHMPEPQANFSRSFGRRFLAQERSV